MLDEVSKDVWEDVSEDVRKEVLQVVSECKSEYGIEEAPFAILYEFSEDVSDELSWGEAVSEEVWGDVRGGLRWCHRGGSRESSDQAEEHHKASFIA